MDSIEYTWARASQDEDLLKACQRFQICMKEPPKTFSYTSFKTIMQDGPQCGLIALAMYCNLTTKEEINDLFNIAKSMNFTHNGEMFSVGNMCALAKMNINKNIYLYSGNLDDNMIVNFLSNKGVLLVPYDSDANHSPCQKNGHKAHWALISGIIKSQDNEIYVLARQGKSKHLGIWSLNDLASSNLQLNEFAPSRMESKLEYLLPEGGISGPNGLNGKCVLIYDEGKEEGRFHRTGKFQED